VLLVDMLWLQGKVGYRHALAKTMPAKAAAHRLQDRTMPEILEPSWSPTATRVLEALGRCVRVLTLEQIARGWFGDDSDVAEKELAPFCNRDLVERHSVFAHPLIEISPPAFHWKPGDPTPSDEKFTELVRHFQGRWGQDDEPYEVYVATRTGVNVVGGYAPDPPKTEQWTHDIHVGEMLVNLIEENNPEVVSSIVGEAALPKLGHDINRMKDPDMFVVDENGSALQVLEFAGAYDEKHIRDLHEHCSGEAHKKLRKHYPGRKHYLYASPEGTQYFLL
jgi:hypothetical protein